MSVAALTELKLTERQRNRKSKCSERRLPAAGGKMSVNCLLYDVVREGQYKKWLNNVKNYKEETVMKIFQSWPITNKTVFVVTEKHKVPLGTKKDHIYKSNREGVPGTIHLSSSLCYNYCVYVMICKAFFCHLWTLHFSLSCSFVGRFRVSS